MIEALGWLGSALIIVAYSLTLNEKNKWGSLSKYLNLVGGLLIAINCFYNSAIPPFVSNLLWSGIAVFSIVKRKMKV